MKERLLTKIPELRVDDDGLDGASAQQARDAYQRIRARVDAWAARKRARDGDEALERDPRGRWILLAPDLLHLLIRLTFDGRVPRGHKVMLAGVIAWFVSPLDLLPDMLLGPIGLLDDVALAAIALDRLINDVDPEIVRGHWAGDGDVLTHVQDIVGTASKTLGKGPMVRLARYLDERFRGPTDASEQQ